MSIIFGMSEQFRTQMRTTATTKEDYQRVINETFVAGYWDLIVAKLDSLLNYITNGSWSLSEKTVLINEIDNLRRTLLGKLNGFSAEALNDHENIACDIDREVFRFVMKNISTRPLLSDVTLSLKLNQGGLIAIQLNSASGLLAEFPDYTAEDFLFQNYDPNKAKHIPQKLSQLLCTLMSLCEQSYLWEKLYSDVYLDLSRNVNDVTAETLVFLNNKYDRFSFYIAQTLSELQCYIREERYDCTPPLSLELSARSVYSEKSELWFSIRDWIKAADADNLSNMLSIKGDISTFLDIA